MRVDLFDYQLPEDLIAQHPVEPRERARLLYVPASDRPPVDLTVAALPSLLRPGDLLVLNDTKVLPARLRGNVGQAAVEVTMLKADHTPRPDRHARWWCLARPGKKLQPARVVSFRPKRFAPRPLTAIVGEKTEDGQILLTFDCDAEELFDLLNHYGEMPLPPYIRRDRGAMRRDEQDYQTVFAARPGAVAAPTASLHLTWPLLKQVAAAGVATVRVTLHIGGGTFLPVKVEDTDAHKMHAEYIEVSVQAARRINAARASGGRVVAIGTTAMRTIESAADDSGEVRSFAGETDLFITPGYRFRCTDALLTNFHLPRSTLLMLVSAFAGRERILDAYRHAVAEGYRFFSYGDATFLERAGP